MNTTSKREAMIEKVRKLLAITNDGRGNLQEAETAMRQAMALMSKFNIDMAEAQLKELDSPDECLDLAFYDQTYDPCARPRKAVEPWVSIIALGVARLTETRVKVARKDGVVGLAFGGYATDVVFAVWLVRLLVRSVYMEARNKFGHSTVKARTDFRFYAAGELQARMIEMARAKESELKAEATQASGTALMVIDKKLQVINERFGEQKTQKEKREPADPKAAMAGMIYGTNVHIPENRPIGQSQQG